LRSGAFGLVILDLGAPQPGRELSMQIQGRLVTLAQSHDAAVVCLTEKTSETASLGSLISLRAEALRRVPAHDARVVRAVANTNLDAKPSPSEFEVSLRILKDKRRGPGLTHALRRRGPPGLR
jgi:recombination protein RecA